jgi:hypothetical protein
MAYMQLLQDSAVAWIMETFWFDSRQSLEDSPFSQTPRRSPFLQRVRENFLRGVKRLIRGAKQLCISVPDFLYLLCSLRRNCSVEHKAYFALKQSKCTLSKEGKL